LDDIEKNAKLIERLAFIQPLIDPDLQMMIRRHTRRNGRPDLNRFMADFIARKTDRPEYVRARARIRKRRSRLKQTGNM
jgi:hypothetical protein